ncbi:MAG: hypothetical protein AAF821_25605 [Cyanobacteria bacterium P01_D01_bin.156]
MPKQDAYYKSRSLYDVLTLVDCSIRSTILNTGFGELSVEFARSDNPKKLRIAVKDTAHHFYQVTAEEMRQFLTSGPHFPESYVSPELWQALGDRFHVICGEGSTGYGQIRLSTKKGNHQQVFMVAGGVSQQFHIS